MSIFNAPSQEPSQGEKVSAVIMTAALVAFAATFVFWPYGQSRQFTYERESEIDIVALDADAPVIHECRPQLGASGASQALMRERHRMFERLIDIASERHINVHLVFPFADALGEFIPGQKRILIRPTLPCGPRLYALIHEVAHAMDVDAYGPLALTHGGSLPHLEAVARPVATLIWLWKGWDLAEIEPWTSPYGEEPHVSARRKETATIADNLMTMLGGE